MNWLAIVAGRGDEPARVVAEVEDELGRRRARGRPARASSSWLAPRCPRCRRSARTRPSRPPARGTRPGAGRSCRGRSTGRAAAPSRSIGQHDRRPLRARGSGDRLVERLAVDGRPSTAVTTSPDSRPARSAGEPSIGATTTSRQVGPIVSQVSVSSSVGRVVTSAPTPENSPPIASRWRRSSSGLMYDENGSSRAPIIPSIAPWTSFCAVDLADVALGDRLPGVPEGGEQLRLGRRGARCGRRAGAQREAGQEERRPGEQGDGGDRDVERADAAARGPERIGGRGGRRGPAVQAAEDRPAMAGRSVGGDAIVGGGTVERVRSWGVLAGSGGAGTEPGEKRTPGVRTRRPRGSRRHASAPGSSAPRARSRGRRRRGRSPRPGSRRRGRASRARAAGPGRTRT